MEFPKLSYPDYLWPYARYFVRPSPWVKLQRIAAGAMALAVIIIGILARLIIRDNFRSNRVPLSEGTFYFLHVADLLIIPGLWFFFYLAMILARSAVSVMRNDPRQPILYLRSFRSDPLFWASAASAEHELVRAVRSLGPVIAIGAPGTTVPPLGAARLRVSDDHWQDVVAELVTSAQLVLLRIGSSVGFFWELEHLVSTADPRKVLIFLPKEDRGAIYTEFRERANKLLPSALPEDSKKATFLAFSSDWTPQLLAAEGPSSYIRLRRWLLSGTAPEIREALREVVTIKPMHLAVREWWTIANALFFVGWVLKELVPD
jgi:hypothetical protein